MKKILKNYSDMKMAPLESTASVNRGGNLTGGRFVVRSRTPAELERVGLNFTKIL